MTLHDKCAAVKFVKPWMSSHFSEQRDLRYVGSAMSRMSQERLARQVLLATLTRKRQRVRPSTGWRGCISGFAWPRLGVLPAELSAIAVDRGVIRVLKLLPLRSSQEEKRVWKWMINECNHALPTKLLFELRSDFHWQSFKPSTKTWINIFQTFSTEESWHRRCQGRPKGPCLPKF